MGAAGRLLQKRLHPYQKKLSSSCGQKSFQRSCKKKEMTQPKISSKEDLPFWQMIPGNCVRDGVTFQSERMGKC